MKSTDTLRRAAKSLRQAKVRTLLTSLAIAVGAFTLMLSLAAGQGARDYADKLISSNVDPNALFIVKDESIVGVPSQQNSDLREFNPDIGNAQGLDVVQLNQDDIESLNAKPYLEDVRPIYQLSADYLTFAGDNISDEVANTKYTAALGVYSPDVLSDHVAGKKMAKGEDLNKTDAVVPESFAQTLGVSADDLVGQEVSVYVSRDPQTLSEAEIQAVIAKDGIDGLAELNQQQTKAYTFTISEVVKPSNLSFADTTAIQIPLEAANEVAEYTTEGTNSYQKYFAVTAKVTGDTTTAEAKAMLEDDELLAQTANDLQGFLFTIVNVLQGIVGGFGVIALIASIFGIVNTQYISVLERTSQIGLMRALGMRGRDVSRLFRYEAAWIGFLGGAIGIVIAWVAGTALNPWISEQLDLGDSIYLLVFDWIQALGLLVALIVVAILAGYFPSRKAAKLDPIEALRTE